MGCQSHHGKQEMGGAPVKRVHGKLKKRDMPVRPAQARRGVVPLQQSSGDCGWYAGQAVVDIG